MPKTYNQRELDQIRREAEHAPPLPDEPDTLTYLKFFTGDEMRAIAKRLELRVAAGKTSTLTPYTARLAAKAIRAYAVQPTRNTIAQALCHMHQPCKTLCLSCIGSANKVERMLHGEKLLVRSDV
jgi:hypothetical protein